MPLTVDAYDAAIDVPRNVWDPTEGQHPRHGERTHSAITGVEVHWTGTPGDIADHGDTDTELLSFERFHEVSNGWTDLFYNVGLDSEGNTYEGRDITVRSQGDLGAWLTLLVVVGPDDTLTTTDTAAIIAGIRRIWEAVDPTLDPATIRTHRRRPASTSCPGDQLDQIVTDLQTNPREADPMPLHEDAQKAADAGFWNGQNPDDPITREHAAITAWRSHAESMKFIAELQATVTALNNAAVEQTTVAAELTVNGRAATAAAQKNAEDLAALATAVAGIQSGTSDAPLEVKIVGIG